jgi:predicted DNA-binding transcriptional regulator AlpA
MAFTFIKPLIEQNAAAAKAKPAKASPSTTKSVKHAPAFDLSQPGRLRAKQIMQILSISRTTFYDRLKNGVYPAADGQDGKTVYWHTETIKALLEK